MPNGNDNKPIVVSANEGGIDGLQATGRYILVLVSSFPVIVSLLRKGDVLAIVDYFRGSEGSLAIAAAIWLVTMGYGILKTWKRGSQVVTVAADPRVPDKVARLK